MSWRLIYSTCAGLFAFALFLVVAAFILPEPSSALVQALLATIGATFGVVVARRTYRSDDWPGR